MTKYILKNHRFTFDAFLSSPGMYASSESSQNKLDIQNRKV